MTATIEQPAFEIVEPSTTHRFSALLYGPEGSWKSTNAASAPGPILYLNGDRKHGIRFARRQFAGKELREVRPTGLATLHNAIFHVRENPEIETVVVDTVGSVFDVVLRSIAQNEKQVTFPEIGRAQDEIEAFVKTLMEEDVNVVLVAHDMTVETAGSEGDGTLLREQMPMCGTSKPSFPRKLMRIVDVVAYCGVKGEGDERHGVAQLFESESRRAKDGTGALAGADGIREPNLTEWAEAINAFYADDGAPENTKPEEGQQ